MIITFTPNPCIDKSCELEMLDVGGLNRLSNVKLDPSGKGMNVSKLVRLLGGETLAVALVGKDNAGILLGSLDERGVPHRCVMQQGSVRVNLKVLDGVGRLTELNESGIETSGADWDEARGILLEYAAPENLFVLSGSLPPGIGPEAYRDLCAELKDKGAQVLVDADGQAMKQALDVPPDYMKPNRFELGQLMGVPPADGMAGLKAQCLNLIGQGVKLIALSLGEKGILFVSAQKTLYAPGLRVKVGSPVGAGDSVVASLAYGVQNGLPFEEIATLAVACSAATAETTGTVPPALERVEQLKQQVALEEV